VSALRAFCQGAAIEKPVVLINKPLDKGVDHQYPMRQPICTAAEAKYGLRRNGMETALALVDGVVRRFGPADAIVSRLADRLLPHRVAGASCAPYFCGGLCATWWREPNCDYPFHTGYMWLDVWADDAFLCEKSGTCYNTCCCCWE
jgi:hypothetical protein